MITSDTSFGSTLARRKASLIATSPSLWAGRVLSPPLNAPTGVRAAPPMTMSVITISSYRLRCATPPELTPFEQEMMNRRRLAEVAASGDPVELSDERMAFGVRRIDWE